MNFNGAPQAALDAAPAQADNRGQRQLNLDEPLIVIQPSRKWISLELGALWTYRDLLYFLTWRDIKVRYKQTLLGAGWAILQPLLAMAIFTLIFGRFAKIPSDGVPYPVFAYVGVMFWNFFSNAITNSSNSLIGNANLISKVYFPRMIVPAAAVGAGLVDMAVMLALLGILMAFYGIAPTPAILVILPLVILTTVLSMGVGLLMSALNVKYRDIRYALPFLVQIWMFATPIIYPASLVPDKWRWAVALNPVSGIVDTARAVLFGKSVDPTLLATSVVITLILLLYASFFFRRMEKAFADVI